MKHQTKSQVAVQTKTKVTVWGLAAGRGTTSEAARGAFTWREYASEADIPKRDWLEIVTIKKQP
jgi:hypothetical protein